MRTQLPAILLLAPALVAAQRGGQSSQPASSQPAQQPSRSGAASSAPAAQPSVIVSTSFTTIVGLTIDHGQRITATMTSPVVTTITVNPAAPPPASGSGAPAAGGSGSAASTSSTPPLTVGPTTFAAGGGAGTGPAPVPGATQNGATLGPGDGYIAGAREQMSMSLVAVFLGLGVMVGVNLLQMN